MDRELRHTVPMRHGIWLLVLVVLTAALGAGSAYAAGTTSTTTTTTTTTTTSTTATTTTTTTASTTTTSTTTTTGTTTTTPPSPPYSRLRPSHLHPGCIGAGAAAIAEPGRPVLTLGTPATSRGPSAYPTKAPIVRFLSATATGSACKTAHVALGSVALFGGAITAKGIAATHGKGTVSGFEIYGGPVALRPGHSVRIGGWGEVFLQRTVGRLTAPLVVQLLKAHHSLPAGTTIAFAFGASPQLARKSTAKTDSNGSQTQAQRSSETKKQRQPSKPPPDFPASPSPFAKSGGFTDAARDNPVVSIAMRYLGVPYQWGGARPRTGFDCSGLVKYVFGQLGVPLVHYAAAQWHSSGGVWIPPDRLQSGDLVFFTGSDGTRKAPGHVGIYVEDGYFIDAPHTGSFVRVDSLEDPRFADEYVGARQVVSQRLLARRLSHLTKPDASATAFHFDVPSPIRPPLGESFGIAVAGTAAARAPSRDYWIWAGVALGGLLLLLVPGGAFAFRRRHTPDAVQSSELSS